MLDPLTSAEAMTADEARAASGLWWVILLYGILSVVVGLYILAHDWTVGSLATFVGIVLIFEGIFNAASPGVGRAWSIGLAILAIVGGIAILVWPARGLLVLAEVVAAYIVVKGVFNLVVSIGSRHAVNYWWLLALAGIVEIGIGLWLMRRPGATLYLVIILTGAWLVVRGVLEIVLAFEIRKLPQALTRAQAGSA